MNNTLTTLRAALDKCKKLSIESGAYESYKAVGEAFEELRTLIASMEAQPEPAYTDSTPRLNVGNSAFEHWFQAQPFATQTGIKQMCRDSYAAGMGDPLVTYAAQPSEPKAEPVQVWCDTCEGSGQVYQEHQAGCHVGGHYECPDCSGKGFNKSFCVQISDTLVQPVEQPKVNPLYSASNLEAFKTYLSDCDQCCIVPDVAGAFIAGWSAQPKAEPDCRNELVTAIHTLASHFEDILYAVQDDKEALKHAEGSIDHAMKIAAKWNWNGTAQPVEQPLLTESQRAAIFFHSVTPSWTKRDDATIRQCFEMMDRAVEQAIRSKQA